MIYTCAQQRLSESHISYALLCSVIRINDILAQNTKESIKFDQSLNFKLAKYYEFRGWARRHWKASKSLLAIALSLRSRDTQWPFHSPHTPVQLPPSSALEINAHLSWGQDWYGEITSHDHQNLGDDFIKHSLEISAHPTLAYRVALDPYLRLTIWIMFAQWIFWCGYQNPLDFF